MQKNDVVMRFAGEGGEGVVTAAEMLARAAAIVGYHVETFVTFPSQIKGGPTWSQVRISTRPCLSAGDHLDVLVALNQEAYKEHHDELQEGGVVVHDSSFEVTGASRAIGVPFGEIAKEAGDPRTKNVAILGVLAKIMGMPEAYFQRFIAERFKGRDAVIQANFKALSLGGAQAEKRGLQIGELAPPGEANKNQLFIKGNDAIALGAIAAGIEFYVGYPISPATPILVFMEKNLVGPGKFAYQVSSEIEAITGIIGGSFAGKKAMTATAGPGLSLMSEGIGLAWMQEVPIVIVDVQRGGPATGLPTKTEQSDLLKALHPAHGDVSIPVIAPGTVEECYYGTIKAFNWAERYQGPVIVLSEHSLAERTKNVAMFETENLQVESRQVYTGNNGYLRYNGSTVSPFPVPGNPGAYVANGSEHDPLGDTTHRPDRHVQMTERRFNKLAALNDATYEAEHTEGHVAVLPWGGSKGPAYEAYQALRARGNNLSWYYTMFLNPLPAKLVAELKKKDLVLVPELNYQGQLASVLRSMGIKAEAITKYTGLPFKVDELIQKVQAAVKRQSKEVVKA
ncbi:MAG: 2-oxoacid:acceptor oxidoreductase subunit alpha [Chloroflexi bacterium]|nr:2-oxoacid:acceptor oxidoreductase subunit alpha [Chloroflexota bacterium]